MNAILIRKKRRHAAYIISMGSGMSRFEIRMFNQTIQRNNILEQQ
jgi:hypothetical protein